MIGRFTKAGATAVLALIVIRPAMAQTARVEVSAGYQFIRAADQTLPIGWSAGVATDLNRTWSVVGEVSGARRMEEDKDLGVDVKLSVQSFGAGARWSSRITARIIPFVQMQAGAEHIAARAHILDANVGDSATNFMLQPGGGVSVTMTKVFGVVGQVDYRRVFLSREDDAQSGENQIRALLGVRLDLR